MRLTFWFTGIAVLRTIEWMAMIVEVWQTGTLRFHFVIFLHWFILRPFFTNIFDCIFMCGLKIDCKKVLLTIYYHVIPFGAFLMYDFPSINTMTNSHTDLKDNLVTTNFKEEYENWNFYYTLIALFPGAIAGALACVLSKFITVKNEAWKIRRNESVAVQSFVSSPLSAKLKEAEVDAMNEGGNPDDLIE
jgi:hypothetical protein